MDDLKVKLQHLRHQLYVRSVSESSSILVFESGSCRGTVLDLRTERVRKRHISILHIQLLSSNGLEADYAG